MNGEKTFTQPPAVATAKRAYEVLGNRYDPFVQWYKKAKTVPNYKVENAYFFAGCLDDLHSFGYVPDLNKDGEVVFRVRTSNTPSIPDKEPEPAEPGKQGRYLDPQKKKKQIENPTDDERAARIAIHRAAASGLIKPDEAYRMQKEIADRMTAEGRGGEAKYADLIYAQGGGKGHAAECFTRLDVKIAHYTAELKKAAGK